MLSMNKQTHLCCALRTNTKVALTFQAARLVLKKEKQYDP